MRTSIFCRLNGKLARWESDPSAWEANLTEVRKEILLSRAPVSVVLALLEFDPVVLPTDNTRA